MAAILLSQLLKLQIIGLRKSFANALGANVGGINFETDTIILAIREKPAKFQSTSNAWAVSYHANSSIC